MYPLSTTVIQNAQSNTSVKRSIKFTPIHKSRSYNKVGFATQDRVNKLWYFLRIMLTISI